MKANLFLVKRLLPVSPLTPARSPFREERAQRATPGFGALSAASDTSPSPLNGERVGPRGEALPRDRLAPRTSTGLVVGWLLLAVVWAAPADAADKAPRPDLRGRVLSADGQPLPKATVFIYTAAPKVGPATVCPSCYPDCAKRAQTGPDGRFTIKALDPKLIFRLLVVAGGFEPQFVPNVDPARGPVEVNLQPFDEAVLKSKSRIMGQVLDSEGAPVVGAVISVQGKAYAERSPSGRGFRGVDPLTVADDRGRFFLRCGEDVAMVEAIAQGRGVAPRWVRLWAGLDHLIRMEAGVTVTGRILQGDKPVKNATVELVTTDPGPGVALRGFEAVTDADGCFAIPNVTSKNEYQLFVRMDSLRGQAGSPVRTFKAGVSGTTVELGDLKVGLDHRVAGRIVLSDGQRVPPNTRVTLSQVKTSGFREAVLDAQGRFEFVGVPAGSVRLDVRIPGYRFATNNPSLDWLNGTIVGRVDRDLDNLVLLMEPGEWPFTRREDVPPGLDPHPSDKPLRGVPLKP